MDIIRSIPQLEALRDEWPAPPAPAASPLLDHAWFACCARALHDESSLRIVTVRERGELTGVAPLAVEGSSFGARLILVGTSSLHEPSGWIARTSDGVRELASAVTTLGRPMLLQRVAVHSGVSAALLAQPRHRMMSVARVARPALGVPITGTWDEYRRRLSTRVTQNLPRLRRRAERQIGRLTFQLLTPGITEVDTHLETFLDIEASGWKGRKGSSLKQRPTLRAFFREYARRAAARGELRIARLSIGNAPAAMELAIEAYQRSWQLKIGYAESLAEFYPGLQLIEFSIRSAFERGLQSYEFLGSAEAWEERWLPEPREFRHIVSYPMNARGVCRAVGDLGRVAWARSVGDRGRRASQ